MYQYLRPKPYYCVIIHYHIIDMSAITETIYQRFHQELECFIVKKVKDKSAAKDILQDIFVKIHIHLHTIKDQSKLNAWIYQLTRSSKTIGH